MSDSTMPLGIDISKSDFHVALLKSAKRSKYEHFSNDADGFEQLSQWLEQPGVGAVHACLEATSIYGHALALYLHQQGHRVSIVNPLRVKGYSKSQLSRTQSDRADAKLIAQFCRDLKPALWQPSATEVSQLQGSTRRLDALEHMLTEEKNRLKVTPQDFEADIVAHIQFLQGQVETVKKRLHEHIQAHESLQHQQALLTSIVGVGERTAARVLAEIGAIEHFDSARQLAAFAGLTPQEHTSGTSVQGKTRLCKIGNRRLRKALYFPALTWWRRCPQARASGERLLAAGKAKMQVIGALMHKLIRVIYGILKSGKPFDPDKLLPRTT
ncbi:MAG: IS110 family transposase [Leptolyngbya sp. SIOISBB]|nr:IS110 family transposase [Leptolyngbya sp. SIOISBB]